MEKADHISNTHYDKAVDDLRLSLFNDRFNRLKAWVFKTKELECLTNHQEIIPTTNYPEMK